MAELKYDLKLVNTVTDKQIQFQPWYKERIRTRMIKSLKSTDTSKILLPSNWSFIKDGLDDFRDGLPPASGDSIRLKAGEGVGPLLRGPQSKDRANNIKQSVNNHRFAKDDICFSKKTPLQRSKQQRIDNIEYELLQHPLALYPHLEESLPPDVFEDVVDVLDPAMNDLQDELDEEVELAEKAESEVQEVESPIQHGRHSQRQQSSVSQYTEDGDDVKAILNPFKWLPKKDERDKKDRKKVIETRNDSPSQDKRIQAVTKDFCDWVEGLGGETNNVEESTIYSLFASGYETKPALSVPIHVVELSNVPHELRMSAAIPQQEGSTHGGGTPTGESQKKDWKYSKSTYVPSWNEKDYGSWYLPTRLWKSRNKGEPLDDPQALRDMEESEVKKKSDALNSDLAPLHGSTAFIEYINNKHTRKPEFLEQVAQIHKKMKEEEEMRKLEAENKGRAKQRRSARKL